MRLQVANMSRRSRGPGTPGPPAHPSGLQGPSIGADRHSNISKEYTEWQCCWPMQQHVTTAQPSVWLVTVRAFVRVTALSREWFRALWDWTNIDDITPIELFGWAVIFSHLHFKPMNLNMIDTIKRRTVNTSLIYILEQDDFKNKRMGNRF